MTYTSIQRNFRGFHYQVDYTTVEDFIDEMRKEENGNREICWAKCFNKKTGEQVAEYHRGDSLQHQKEGT